MLVKWMSLDFIYIFTFAKKDCNLSTSICRSTRPYLDCNVSTICFAQSTYSYYWAWIRPFWHGQVIFGPGLFQSSSIVFLLFNPSHSPAHGRPLHTDKRNTDKTEGALISKTEQLKNQPEFVLHFIQAKDIDHYIHYKASLEH